MTSQIPSLTTSVLPSFANEIGYDVKLLKLISKYQQDPGTQTYRDIKKKLVQPGTKKTKNYCFF